jgi:hypothetical protein
MKDRDTKLIYEAHFDTHPDENTFSRKGPYTKSIYILADGEGVYGAYTEEKAANVARADVGGGSYITKVPVDQAPERHDEFLGEDEELSRVDPEGAAFMDALNRFKQLILKGQDQEARDMTELMRVDFNTDWENEKEDLAQWLVADAGYDGASASELLDVEVNDHGDVVGPSLW